MWWVPALLAEPAAAEEPDAWQAGAAWTGEARALINTAWNQRLAAVDDLVLEARPYVTIVRVAVDAEGVPVEVLVTRSSGVDALDQAVVDAVLATRLPAPPPDAVLGGRYVAHGLLFQVTPAPPAPPPQKIEDVVTPVSNGLGPSQDHTS